MSRTKGTVIVAVHVQVAFKDWITKEKIKNIQRLMRKYYTIHMTASDDTAGEYGCRLIPEIEAYVDEEIEWDWGYDPESFLGEERRWVIESPFSDHKYTWIPEELRNWKPVETVLLVGGCRTACLGNCESILDYLGIEYKKPEGCIYS